MVNTLFYYYNLFYRNVFKDSDSYFTARLALTASESLLIISVLDISSSYFFCYSLNKFYMAGITLIILALNLLFFLNSKVTKRIEKSKPKFFKSHRFSILITLLFFLATTSSMFWLGNVVEDIIGKCSDL